MKRSFRPVLALTLAGGLANCTSSTATRRSQQPLETPDRFTIYFRDDAYAHATAVDAPVDEVWKVVPAVFRELGYPGAQASGAGYVFITPNLQIRGRLYPEEPNSKYIDCGTGITGARADSYVVWFAIVTRVRPGAEGGSIVETAIDGNARDRAHSSNAVRCSGTGVLERAIGEMIVIKVKA